MVCYIAIVQTENKQVGHILFERGRKSNKNGPLSRATDVSEVNPT